MYIQIDEQAYKKCMYEWIAVNTDDFPLISRHNGTRTVIRMR